jgi:hypothetical protein
MHSVLGLTRALTAAGSRVQPSHPTLCNCWLRSQRPEERWQRAAPNERRRAARDHTRALALPVQTTTMAAPPHPACPATRTAAARRVHLAPDSAKNPAVRPPKGVRALAPFLTTALHGGYTRLILYSGRLSKQVSPQPCLGNRKLALRRAPPPWARQAARARGTPHHADDGSWAVHGAGEGARREEGGVRARRRDGAERRGHLLQGVGSAELGDAGSVCRKVRGNIPATPARGAAGLWDTARTASSVMGVAKAPHHQPGRLGARPGPARSPPGVQSRGARPAVARRRGGRARGRSRRAAGRRQQPRGARGAVSRPGACTRIAGPTACARGGPSRLQAAPAPRPPVAPRARQPGLRGLTRAPKGDLGGGRAEGRARSMAGGSAALSPSPRRALPREPAARALTREALCLAVRSVGGGAVVAAGARDVEGGS